MALKEIDLNKVALPGTGQGMSFAPTVDEFIASGFKAAEIEDERSASTVLQGVRAYLGNHPELDKVVKVTSRGAKDENGKMRTDTVILARRDALKNGGYTKAQRAEQAAKAAEGNGQAPEGDEAPAEGTDDLAPEFDVNIP